MHKIAIHGVPRSGTSWLGSIFDSSSSVAYRHQPLFSYAFKSYLSEKSTKKEINDFFTKILKTNDEFILQKAQKKLGTIPEFKKSTIEHVIYKEARYHYILNNLLAKDNKLKVIGIIRNPKSVIYSWYNAPKEFDKNNWNLLKEWEEAEKKNAYLRENYYGYNKWKEVANLFLDLKSKFKNRFYLVVYEDLLLNTESVVKHMFAFAEIKYSVQTQNYLKNSKSIDMSNDAYSVFRINQIDDKWRKFLPQQIIDTIDIDLKGTKLFQFNNQCYY